MSKGYVEWQRAHAAKSKGQRPEAALRAGKRATAVVLLLAVISLALWESGVRVDVKVRRIPRKAAKQQARALRAVTQAGGAADAADTARPQRIEEVAAVAAARNLFAGEPRYDPAADPFAQLATFDRSALIAPGFDSRLLTFSQGLEDKMAYDSFFYKMVGGVFLEVGAMDGVTYSNSFVFERFAGWRGVLIEPGPTNFAMLRHNRPAAANVHAAVCSKTSTVHFVEAGPVGGILEFMSPEFREAWHQGVDPAALLAVSCFKLSSILQASGVDHINFFSLDVAGAELDVLQTFDFGAVRVDVMVVGALAGADSAQKNAAVDQLLAAHGMQLYSIDDMNHWYVRRGFKPSRNPVLPPRGDSAAAAAAHRR